MLSKYSMCFYCGSGFPLRVQFTFLVTSSAKRFSLLSTLLDPGGARPGESGEDGAAVEVSAKCSRPKAESIHHTKRLVSHTNMSINNTPGEGLKSTLTAQILLVREKRQTAL